MERSTGIMLGSGLLVIGVSGWMNLPALEAQQAQNAELASLRGEEQQLANETFARSERQKEKAEIAENRLRVGNVIFLFDATTGEPIQLSPNYVAVTINSNDAYLPKGTVVGDIFGSTAIVGDEGRLESFATAGDKCVLLDAMLQAPNAAQLKNYIPAVQEACGAQQQSKKTDSIDGLPW